MKENNKISIVVASDNHYAILIVALLKSIEVNHNSGGHIDFHIIDDGISVKFKKKLETIVNPEHITIKWHKSKNVIPQDAKMPIDSNTFPLITYMRIFSPFIVDNDVERLLYLDVDTIVQDDISKLWNTPLDGYTIGAILDVAKTVDSEWGGIANYKELGLDPKTKYFNSGVLLMDLNKWRSQRISDQIIEVLGKYKAYVKLADQYGFNVVFANKWKEIDPKWNWFAFKEDENPSLIHFLDIKPIFKSYHSQEVYKDEFFRYLSMTPWKNVKPISGNYRTLRKAVNKVKNTLMKLFK